MLFIILAAMLMILLRCMGRERWRGKERCEQLFEIHCHMYDASCNMYDVSFIIHHFAIWAVVLRLFSLVVLEFFVGG